MEIVAQDEKKTYSRKETLREDAKCSGYWEETSKLKKIPGVRTDIFPAQFYPTVNSKQAPTLL